MRFFDRQEAGKLLAGKLEKYRNTDSVILAIPRGGVPVAAEVAKRLKLPMDLVLVKKIGHPGNKEYALGAVGLSEEYLPAGEDYEAAYVENEISNARFRLQEMRRRFKGNMPFIDLRGRNAIVVDDGIATGKTLLATVRILKKSEPASIIIAVPVISANALEKLGKEVTEIIPLYVPDYFTGVGAFYEHFGQVSDEEVCAIMQETGTDKDME